jgi:hypothetical protein
MANGEIISRKPEIKTANPKSEIRNKKNGLREFWEKVTEWRLAF